MKIGKFLCTTLIGLCFLSLSSRAQTYERRSILVDGTPVFDGRPFRLVLQDSASQQVQNIYLANEVPRDAGTGRGIVILSNEGDSEHFIDVGFLTRPDLVPANEIPHTRNGFKSWSQSILFADINPFDSGPSISDLLVLNRGTRNQTSGLSALVITELAVGNGAPGFREFQYLIGAEPASFAVGNFDGDGLDDVVITASSTFFILINKRDNFGRFTAADYVYPNPDELEGVSSVYAFQLTDDNGDNKIDAQDLCDLVVLSRDALHIYHNKTIYDPTRPQSGIRFDRVQSLYKGGQNLIVSIILGDIDQDGRKDLLYTYQETTTTSGGQVVIVPGDGRGRFDQEETRRITVFNNPHSVHIHDFNRDGRMDIILAHGYGGGPVVVIHADENLSFPRRIVVNNRNDLNSQVVSLSVQDGPVAQDRVFVPVELVKSDLNKDGEVEFLTLVRTQDKTQGALILFTPQRPLDRLRGDFDGDMRLLLTDAIRILNHLFQGGPPVEDCPAVEDVDSSGGVNISDGIFLLRHLFQGGPAPGPLLTCEI